MPARLPFSTPSAIGRAAVLAVAAALAPLMLALAALAQAPPPLPSTPRATETGRGEGVQISEPWARATPGGARVGVAFLEIKVAPGGGDRLVGAASDVAGSVELHEMTRDGDVMRMRRVDGIDIPAGGTLQLKPGGLHLMLIDLHAPLVAGKRFPIRLTFAKAGTIEVMAVIARIGAMSPGAGPGPHPGHH